VARGNRAVRLGLSVASYLRVFIVPLMPGIGKRLKRNNIARRLGPQALGVDGANGNFAPRPELLAKGDK
jgi:hypothetical protein